MLNLLPNLFIFLCLLIVLFIFTSNNPQYNPIYLEFLILCLYVLGCFYSSCNSDSRFILFSLFILFFAAIEFILLSIIWRIFYN